MAPEELLNAQINFENAEKMMPLLKEHPIFQIAKEQLAAGIKMLETSNETCEREDADL